MSAPPKVATGPQVVVVGAGFGGLAAAIRLQARGFRVTLVDKRDSAGGRAYVYRQDGFTFDAGPTIVTAPFLFEELWKLCGRRLSDDVTLKPVSPFYRIRFQDGSHFDYTGDPASMRAEIAKFSPGDVAGYEKYMLASEAIFKVGFEQLGDVPFSKWTDMARIAPEMLKLESYRSVFSLVSKFVKDERLRVVLSFHPLLIGGNPLTASSIYCLIAHLERHWGVHFAMGGTNQLVNGNRLVISLNLKTKNASSIFLPRALIARAGSGRTGSPRASPKWVASSCDSRVQPDKSIFPSSPGAFASITTYVFASHPRTATSPSSFAPVLASLSAS